MICDSKFICDGNSMVCNRMRTRCGASCAGGGSMRCDDAFGGCRAGPVLSNQSRLSSAHGGQPAVGGCNPAEVGGTGHPLLVNRSISGNSMGLPLGASPAVKSVRPLSSLARLKAADMPSRDTYSQRVQVR